jgi:hypothetical protein
MKASASRGKMLSLALLTEGAMFAPFVFLSAVILSDNNLKAQTSSKNFEA